MRKFIFALAFGALLLPDYGFTLGLGEIEVSTALNQELNAEIELLSAAPEDVETLIVKLASREEFSRAGIERPFLLNALRFSAEINDGVPIIRVTSDKPIREPFLNFLVEIDWPKGHMMREYTILLDPPVFMEQAAPPPQETSRPAAMETSRPSAVMSEPQSDSGFRPAAMASTPAMPAAATAPSSTVSDVRAMPAQTYEPQPVPAYTRSYEPPGGYRIQPGDTLWSLADAMRPDQSVSIEQMMLAMLRSNPEAFINENVNGLKKGFILRIPDRDDIVSMNHADAVAVVREQNALWREYRETVTGGTPAPALGRDADTGEGMVIEDSQAARLEIVAAGSGLTASGTKDPTQMSAGELRAELARARETLETERLEKEALQQRVSALEGQVDRMKSLLTLEDADMAEMQQAAMPVETEAMPEAGLTEEVIAEDEQELLVDEAALEDATALEELTVEDTMAMDEAVDELAVDEAEPAFFDEEMSGEEQLEAVDETVVQPGETYEDYAVTPPAFTQPQKQDPLSMLLNNPMLLAAAGGGLLLVLLLIALIMKRRKSGASDKAISSNLEDIDAQLDDSEVVTILDDEPEQLAEVEDVARTRAEAPETESAAARPSMEDTLADSAQAAEAEDEPRDDVIAEADVYLAYGIYQQAEELLQNALKDNPDKDSYRVKLAETYLASKNADAFVELATDMNQRRNGADTPAWRKVASIGQELVPGHALFTGAADGDLDVAGLSVPATEIMDSAAGVDTDLDLGLDETVDAAEQAATATVDDLEFDLAETGAHEADEEEDEAGVEFDLTETQAMEAAQTTQEFSLDIEAAELGIDEEAEEHTESGDDFDLDLSAEAETLTADDASESGDIALDEISEDMLEFDAEEAEVSEDSPGEEPAEEATILDFADAAAEAETGSIDDEELDLSELDDIDEVSTKLDLAKAYLDMGDADGTRSILDEVMSEGNDQQKKEADELLRQLG